MPIAYGFPDEEAFAAEDRGEVELGGCVIGPENRACRALPAGRCGPRRVRRLQQGQPAKDRMVAKHRGACPKCDSEKVVPIVYGFPTDETMEAARRGEVSLGGCIIMGDDPNRECQDCGHQWRAARTGTRTRRGPPRRSARG